MSSNKPLKVLLLTHRVPYPPDKGDRIRSYQLLRHLARHHRVSLAALADEPVADESLAALSQQCDRVAVVPQSRLRWVRGLASLLTGRPITEGLFRSPRLQQLLDEWMAANRFDVVIGYCSSMAQYLFSPALARLPAVVDLVDVDSAKWRDYARSSHGWRKWLYGLEARRIERLESRLAERCRAVAVVSEREAAAYRAFEPGGRVEVVPNGVDLEYFHDRETDDGRAAASRKQTLNGEMATCVFVGALDYFPNVDGIQWFCEHVWPGVRAALSGATLALVGRNPSRDVRRLGALGGVQVVGGVPNVRPYVRDAHVAIAPLRIARGVQNKVLEAMALGRPVVVSPQAAEGLPRRVRDAAVIAATGAEWVRKIELFVRHPDLARRQGALGRAAVEADCRWEKCLLPWESLLRDAAAAPSTPALAHQDGRDTANLVHLAAGGTAAAAGWNCPGS